MIFFLGFYLFLTECIGYSSRRFFSKNRPSYISPRAEVSITEMCYADDFK